MKYINNIDGTTYKSYTYRMDYPGGYYYEGSKYEAGCNPENTKEYEGTRRSDHPKAELHRSLMGTGVKTITGIFDTPQQAVAYEVIRHEALDLSDPKCLNVGRQQSVGFVFQGSHTEESKLKISEAMTGELNPMYGKSHDLSAKIKMRQNHADFSGENHPQYGRRGVDSHMYGKSHSEETKALMSETALGGNNPFYGSKHKLYRLPCGKVVPKNILMRNHRSLADSATLIS